MQARLIARVAGTVLVCGSLGVAAYVGAWDLRASSAGSALTRRAVELATPAPKTSAPAHPGAGQPAPAPGCLPTVPPAGQLMGLLEVPAIGLRAPVVEGEDDSTLADAVGHDISSVLPGDDGTAVLAAHDVTYFGSLPALRPRDVVRYFDGCDEHTFDVVAARVVPAGSPVPDSLRPTLVLDTCWPTDALWWTPDRYLVLAQEVAVTPDRSPVAPSASVGATSGDGALSVPVPAALAAQGLGLDQNDVLLGTLTVSSRASPALASSAVPLEVDAAAMTAYFGGLRALAQDRTDWWRAIAPGVAPPAAALGAVIATYDTRLDVRVLATGARATGAVLQAVVEMAGDAAPGAYTLRAVMAVRGEQLVISSWSLTP